MGAVAGHMDHPYDNYNLTFGGLKDMLTKASEGELEAQEKVDGQNLFLSYSLPENEMIYVPADSSEEANTKLKGVAKSARNKGNLRNAGMNAEQLAQKFASHSRPGIRKAFVDAFNAFEVAVEALSDEEKVKIFGPQTNNWYNAEVMDPGTTRPDGSADPEDPGAVNVIKYDDKTIKIHDVGHFEFDRETGEKTPLPQGSFETLDAAIGKMQEALHGHDYSLARNALIQLQKLEDELPLQQALNQINSQMKQEGLKDSNTIADYLYSRLFKGIDSEMSPSLKDGLVKYILELPGNIGLRALKKGLSPEDLQDLNSIVNAKRSLRLQAIEPIEMAVHNFAVELLKGVQSLFIANPDKEIKRLRGQLADVVKTLQTSGSEDPARMDVLKRQLNKIKDFNQINTTIEAIVFDYDGHTYKFSGNFAPLNQILGLTYNTPATKTESQKNPGSLLKEDDNSSVRTDKAEKFVLSLPKFVPTEAWGNPNSMQRSQIQRIFDTVGGGATIQEKLDFLNKSVNNPSGRIRSPRRIISTLILLESLSAVINSFNEASAGFVFEGFLSALFRGKQQAGRSEKGNLPIEDLIAFSELGSGKSVPISLKLLNQTTKIEGSYTNLVDAMDEWGTMVYIVARKNGEEIAIEKFDLTRDNFIQALIRGSRGELVKEANLFQIPGKTVEESIELLESLSGDVNWPKKYQLLLSTAGYHPLERARKEKAQKMSQKGDTVTVSSEVPDGEDIEVDIEEKAANRRMYSVAENRRLLAKTLLFESSQRQWSISPAQLRSIAKTVDYESLGSLPYSSSKIVEVAKSYMDFLSDNLMNVFVSTKELSDQISNYFTVKDRSKAITSGEKAIQSSDTIGREMESQIQQDRDETPANIREDVYTPDIQQVEKANGKRIALFPGKFKPPHRGHYEFAKKIAQRKDVDEVVVIISPDVRGLQPEVGPKQSYDIWHNYLSKPGAPDNIQVQISPHNSPVTQIYEFVADEVKARPGDTVYVIKSSKDDIETPEGTGGDKRFAGVQSWAERHNPGVNVEEIVEKEVVRPDGSPYHGGDVRKLIKMNNKEEFAKFLPVEKGIDPDEIWNIIKPLDAVEREVDQIVDEMSTVSAGLVSGPGGSVGFGPMNRYNPFDTNIYNTSPGQRGKIKRPKRKKAKKRQKRR